MPAKLPGIRLFLDINETLIRTGEVSAADRLVETAQLNAFVVLCRRIVTRCPPLEIVLLTGNSFEYTRRVEEPLGLKNLKGASVVIVSENGLLARSFQQGDIWRIEPAESYALAVRDLLTDIARDHTLRGCYYTQGNEIRVTLKPVADKFTDSELALLKELSGRHEGGALLTHTHPYYFDVDPRLVQRGDSEVEFGGKEFAVREIIRRSGRRVKEFAFGDSASDVPMFRAVHAVGGSCYWVGNATAPESFLNANLLEAEYCEAVNSVLLDLAEAAD